MELGGIERERLIEQQRLDGLKTSEERNQLGQFATPPLLAEDILQYAKGLIREEAPNLRFLDPAIGTGSFYSALRKVFTSQDIEAAVGVELDPAFAAVARSLWADTGLNVVEADFTRERPPETKLYNLIVSNPPYVRHHHLEPTAKEHLQRLVMLRHGIRISGLAGLYCYFLLLSDAWLEAGGLSVWLIPSEFMDVNYGHALKRYLTERVELIRVHRFRPADVQFSDALVSSAIVVFKKTLPKRAHEVQVSFGGSLLYPDRSAMVPLDILCASRKWSAFPCTGVDTSAHGNFLTLGDLFTIKRGLATGANGFFIVTEQQAVHWGIPAAFRRSILPNPRYLNGDVVEADASGCPINTVRLWLIDCDLAEDQIESEFPQFWRYLQTGKSGNIQTSYLASRRSPWYSQEKREAAPYLFTYMGRSNAGRRPFRVIWNKSAATAHNVYLLLYPSGILKKMLEQDPGLQPVVFQHLQAIDTSFLLGEGRVYGGGLHKLEPKELARVPAQSLWEALAGADPRERFLKPEQLSIAW